MKLDIIDQGKFLKFSRSFVKISPETLESIMTTIACKKENESFDEYIDRLGIYKKRVDSMVFSESDFNEIVSTVDEGSFTWSVCEELGYGMIREKMMYMQGNHFTTVDVINLFNMAIMDIWRERNEGRIKREWCGLDICDMITSALRRDERGKILEEPSAVYDASLEWLEGHMDVYERMERMNDMVGFVKVFIQEFMKR